MMYVNNERDPETSWYTRTDVWFGLISAATVIAQTLISRSSLKVAIDSAAASVASAKVAQDQLRAMKEKDRAKLAVVMDVPEIMPGPLPLIGDSSAMKVSLKVHNHGSSLALNVQIRAYYVTVSDPQGREIEVGYIQDAPDTIGNTKKKGPVTVRIRVLGFRNEELPGTTSEWVTLSPEVVKRLQEGKRFLQARGLIFFTDIYGDHHETPFDFVWRNSGSWSEGGNTWRNESYWLNRGVNAPDERNYGDTIPIYP